MANHVYEGMFLLDSNRYARDPGGISKQIDQMVQDCGGEMLASRLWSEQKLAYPIEGHRKGTYWLTYFRMDSLKQGELTRSCRLNENILRNLVIRIDDRLVETLVEHAKSSSSATGSGSTAASTGGPGSGRPGAGATTSAGATVAAGSEATSTSDAAPEAAASSPAEQPEATVESKTDD